MEITAALVKELRERTGLGMMDCKKALVEANGDMDAAIDYVRKKGLTKAAKTAGRIAADGVIAIVKNDHATVIVEVNCETDFTAGNENFLNFAQAAAEAVLKVGNENVQDFVAYEALDRDHRQPLVAKIGENIQVRRAKIIPKKGVLGSYLHTGNKIGVVVALEGGDESIAHDVAMHIAGMNPLAVDETSVAPEALAKEREIFRAQAVQSGKPAEIIEKVVEGQVHKFLKESCLNYQSFVKDPDVTVGDYLKSKQAKVISFVRFKVGEGIDKVVTDFAAEVAAMAKGS